MKLVERIKQALSRAVYGHSEKIPAILESERPTPEQFGSGHNRWVSPRTIVVGGNRHPRVEIVRD